MANEITAPVTVIQNKIVAPITLGARGLNTYELALTLGFVGSKGIFTGVLMRISLSLRFLA